MTEFATPDVEHVKYYKSPRDGRIVARLNNDALEQVFDRNLFAYFDKHA